MRGDVFPNVYDAERDRALRPCDAVIPRPTGARGAGRRGCKPGGAGGVVGREVDVKGLRVWKARTRHCIIQRRYVLVRVMQSVVGGWARGR